MMNPDGSLRQRHVSQPVSQPVSESSWNEEEIVRKRIERRQRERQEDLAPVDPKVFAFVIGLLILCCWAGWYFILQHGPHWVIHEMHQGHVANVIHYFNEHHELGTIDKLYNNKETFLHHAVESNQPEIVKLLLGYEANPAVVDNHLQTPLHYAVYHAFPKIVQILVDHGAPVTKEDDHGRSPLSIATHYNKNNPSNVDRQEVPRIVKEAAYAILTYADILRIVKEAKEKRDREQAEQGLGQEF